jgi:hypothetical protein
MNECLSEKIAEWSGLGNVLEEIREQSLNNKRMVCSTIELLNPYEAITNFNTLVEKFSSSLDS